MIRNLLVASCVFLITISTAGWPNALAGPPPSAPTDPMHPGSTVYSYDFTQKNLNCSGREVNVFLPNGGGNRFPIVVFGHGQALGLSAYKATFEHLAKKGVAVIFPAYDNGFFDQDWQRMGKDYLAQIDCATSQISQLDPNSVVYSGHSKGAYVASIAAGLATEMRTRAQPRAIVLLEAAGADSATLPKIPHESSLTVVFSDRDTVVSRDFSETIYARAGSGRKQFIFMKSYTQTSPALAADHMWPINEKTFFGGGPIGALHYYGSWKWLVAAATDVANGSRFNEPYLYGAEALDKGIPGLTESVKRNWQ